MGEQRASSAWIVGKLHAEHGHAATMAFEDGDQEAVSSTRVRRLNWGSGGNVRDGWINADRTGGPNVDLVGDIREGLPIESATIDYAVSVHALQELGYSELGPALEELRRVLRPGGTLRLVLPDLDAAIRAYLEHDEEHFLVDRDKIRSQGGRFISHILWHGHSRTLFTFDSIEELLIDAGFVDVTACRYGETSTRFAEIVELDNREPDSLYVEGRKPLSEPPLVEVTEVSLTDLPSAARGRSIDGPRPGDRSDGGSMTIVGWVLGREARASELEVLNEGEIVGRVPFDVPRPDLERAFNDIGGAIIAGFRIELAAEGYGRSELVLNATFEDGTRAQIGAITTEASPRVPLLPPGAGNGAARPPITTRIPALRGIAADDLLWIFGFARSGTTWLASMLGDLPGYEVWDEPLVGALFGNFYELRNGDRQPESFILAPQHRRLWIASIRSMALAGATARHARTSQAGCLVIKEPHGSLGAELISEALPESRMMLMLRDPRDVLSSALDSQRQGSWTSDTPHWADRSKPVEDADLDPDAFVERVAARYRRHIDVARRALESHRGPKARVKYEDLRAQPLSALLRCCDQLDLQVEREAAAAAIEHRSWERIPSWEKGPGRFFRKAQPGGWREDLTPDQIDVVEKTARPILDEFYSA